MCKIKNKEKIKNIDSYCANCMDETKKDEWSCNHHCINCGECFECLSSPEEEVKWLKERK